jgi:NTE family protein
MKREIPSNHDPRLGLALSGGGMRGLAHLGVLKALEEHQIRLQSLAGTSMGSLIAGAYAAGVAVDDLIAFGHKIGIIDVAAPDRSWRGLFCQRKLSKLLADLLGSETLTFEDLRMPTAAIATDIETGELVILDRGPLIPALLASSALPLFFAPVRHQGRWLIDGGVLNNLPVDVVRRLGADRVIGVEIPLKVDLDVAASPAAESASGPSLRGLLQLRQLSGDWRRPFLIAEAGIGMTQRLINQTRYELCPPDVILTVTLPNVGMLINDTAGEVIEAGRRVTAARIGEIRALNRPLPGKTRRAWRDLRHRLKRAWRAFRMPAYPLYPGEKDLFSHRD